MSIEGGSHNIELNGQKLKLVKTFKYLRSILGENGTLDDEVDDARESIFNNHEILEQTDGLDPTSNIIYEAFIDNKIISIVHKHHKNGIYFRCV